jgi:hypothetical protein
VAEVEPVVQETPDVSGAFPRLSDAQIDALSARGERRAVEAGDVLFREGDATCDFFVSWPAPSRSSRHATSRNRSWASTARDAFSAS